MRFTPHLWGWSIWWNGWKRMSWGYNASYSYGFGPFSLEQGFVG